MTDQNENNDNNETPKETDASEQTGNDTVTSASAQESYRPEPEPEVYPSGIWMRALHMIIFMVLFGVAETLLFFMAIFQFLWMLFTKKRNPSVAQFGDMVSEWLRDVGRFQSGATDDKPFPWSDMK